MKIRWRTAHQREIDRLQSNKEWRSYFAFWPRRAQNNDRMPLQYCVVGRCVRKRVPRDGDGLPPYIWIYMDRNDAVAAKLTDPCNT